MANQLEASDDFTKEALESVGAVRAHTQPSTTSAVIGLAPKGAVFEEVILIDNWVAASCKRPIIMSSLPVDQDGTVVNPNVCWMSGDYFASKDIPN